LEGRKSGRKVWEGVEVVVRRDETEGEREQVGRVGRGRKGGFETKDKGKKVEDGNEGKVAVIAVEARLR
jgi:hypothetical protein